MPGPDGVPTGIWEQAETKEMEDVIGLYGKTYHFWQVDRGDKLPLGGPELMTSFTKEEDCPDFEKIVGERDGKYGISHEQKADKRAYITEPEIHNGAVSYSCMRGVLMTFCRCRSCMERFEARWVVKARDWL